MISSINWKKTFFTIWTGQAFSHLSSSILQFAIVWYLTDNTGSPMVLTIAMMMGFLPQGILGLFIGVFIDRYNRKYIMIISDLFISLVSFIMVIAGWMGILSTELILAILFLRSVGSAFHTPCLQAVTPQIVPKDQLTKCSGYSQAVESVSQILSPVIAAVLYSTWNITSIVFLDVIGALIAVFTLIITTIPKLQQDKQNGKIRIFQEAKEGFQILKTNKGMFLLVLIGSVYTLALMPISALFPLMSMSYFNGTSTNASIVEVVFSIGFLLGSLILAKWGGTKNRIHTIVGSFLLMSLSLIITGFLPTTGFKIFVVCSLLMGVSGPFYWGTYTPLLQSNFEGKYLGRVLSLSASIRLLTGPMGLTISGIIAEKYSVVKWFLIAGSLVLLASILCLTIPTVRNCDTQNQ